MQQRIYIKKWKTTIIKLKKLKEYFLDKISKIDDIKINSGIGR